MKKEHGKKFSDLNEIIKALDNNVNLHTKIITRIKDNKNGKLIRVETTPGRMLLGNLLPKNKNINYNLVNKVLTKKEISNIIDTSISLLWSKRDNYFCRSNNGIRF